MIFNTDYWNSLNRKEKEEVMLNPANIGYSLGGQPLENLKSGIFTGANTVELTFFSAPGKGQNKESPEMWGKNERQEMKELARVNEVDVSVHASPNMGSGGAALSGFDGQQRKFSDAARKKALDEIQRTAEFAADVAGGGPVVIHLDGFPREIFRADAKEGTFEEYPYEEHKAPVYFVDKTNGDVIPVSRETKVPMPIEKNGEYVKDPETGAFKVKLRTFKEIEEKWNNLPEKNKQELEKDGITNSFSYFYNEYKKSTMQEAEARRQEFVHAVKRYEKMKDLFDGQIKAYDEIKKLHDPTAAKKIFMKELMQDRELAREILSADDKEQQKIFNDPRNYLKEQRDVAEIERKIASEGVLGYARQVEQEKQAIGNHMEITEYGVAKEADTIARAAINLKGLTKKKKLKEPLWVAPENWYEGFHGSHPQELKHVIQESRNRMVELLTAPKLENPYTGEMEKNKAHKSGISKEAAKKLAEDHIRATFDIGHLNIWRKYHKGSDKDFDKWVKKNVRDLIQDKIIGHVHLSDNFGYYDEHLELGEGNAPLQDFMKILKEEGYEGKTIVEPGGQRKDQTHRVWTSALKAGMSPIYRIDAAAKTWTDIEGSYFGRTQSPTFMVGDYVPSKDWTLWSEVPFE